MGMGYAHPYGRLAKPMPNGTGKAFYVVPSTSTLIPDIMDLYTPDGDATVRTFTDIASAISSCVAGRGDYIYLYPGTYTITTALAMSVSDVHLIGLGNMGEAILTGSAANVMNITASGIEVANCQINLASTKFAIQMVGVSNCNIHDNVFLSAVGGAASWYINMNTTACNYNWIHDNKFISNLVVAAGAITQTGMIQLLGIGNTVEHNTLVAGRATTANAGAVTTGIKSNNASDMANLIRWNSFSEANGATFTAGLDYGTTSVQGAVLNYSNNFYLATAANAVVNGSNSEGFDCNVANGTV